MELFAKAVKTGLTFSSVKGTLLPQDLYKMPLTGNNGFNLDQISRELLKVVRSTQEDSLVVTSKVNPTDQLRLEVLKFIIEDKQADEQAATLLAVKKAQRESLLALKAKKQQDQLGELSLEDIDAKLAELG